METTQKMKGNTLALEAHQPVHIAEVVDKMEQLAKRSLLRGLLWSYATAAV